MKGIGFKRTAAILAIIVASIWTIFSLLGAAVISLFNDMFGSMFDELAMDFSTDVQRILDTVQYIFIGLAVLSIAHIVIGSLFCSGRKRQLIIGIILIAINALFVGLFIYILIGAEAVGLLAYIFLGPNVLIILFTIVYLIVGGSNSNGRIESSYSEN